MIHHLFLQSSYSVGGTESDLAGTVELSGRGTESVPAVSTLLNSPSKRLSKSPLAMLLVGIEDNVHETMECRDESALRCGCLHAKLSATVTGENYVRESTAVPHFTKVWGLSFSRSPRVCRLHSNLYNVASHFISPSPHIISFRYPELSSSALRLPSSGIKW